MKLTTILTAFIFLAGCSGSEPQETKTPPAAIANVNALPANATANSVAVNNKSASTTKDRDVSGKDVRSNVNASNRTLDKDDRGRREKDDADHDDDDK